MKSKIKYILIIQLLSLMAMSVLHAQSPKIILAKKILNLGGKSQQMSYDKVNKAIVTQEGFTKISDLNNLQQVITDISDAFGVAVSKDTLFAFSSPNGIWFATYKRGVITFGTNIGGNPGMLAFTPDGKKLVALHEGKPNSIYTIDPEAQITILDITTSLSAPTIRQINFSDFNKGGLRESELPKGVRIFGYNAPTVAKDLEPANLSISADGKKAFVTLQENNAIAVIDLELARVEKIMALGYKNHSIPGNAFDASDMDSRINIKTWPVFGMYQPDAVLNFISEGKTYLMTANEGASRAYYNPAKPGADKSVFVEERRLADKKGSNFLLTLDSQNFNNTVTSQLRKPENLGRLVVSNMIGDNNNDKKFDSLFTFGARSFSVWDEETGALVFDSGNDFEVKAEAYLRQSLNESDTLKFNRGPIGTASGVGFDGSSDFKGPAPEKIAVGTISGKTFAFITIKGHSGVMVYDITDPVHPVFDQYLPSDNINDAPNSILFVPAEISPSGSALLIIGNEGTYSLSVYSVESDYDPSFGPTECPGSLKLLSMSIGGIALNWSGNSVKEEGSVIERSTSSLTGFISVASLLGTNLSYYKDITAMEGNNYYYRVRDYNVSGLSCPSPTLSVPFLLAPTQAQLDIISSSSITLKWQDKSQAEEGFQIERLNSEGVFSIVGMTNADVTTFTDASLEQDKSYIYRLKAVKNSIGLSSSYLATISGTTFLKRPDTLFVSCTERYSKLRLAFLNTSSQATNYLIERSNSKNEFGFNLVEDLIIDPQKDTIVTVNESNNFVLNKPYYYRVKALKKVLKNVDGVMTLVVVNSSKYSNIDSAYAKNNCNTTCVSCIFSGSVPGITIMPTVTGVSDYLESKSVFKAFPNPFTEETMLEYELSKLSDVQVIMFNTLGKGVKGLNLFDQAQGKHILKWSREDSSGNKLIPGTYFVILRANGQAFGITLSIQ